MTRPKSEPVPSGSAGAGENTGTADAEMVDASAPDADQVNVADQSKRNTEGTSSASPEKKKLKASTTGSGKGDSLPTEKLGPDGVPIWDLGGCGDCGFRCLTAIQAFRNNKTKAEIEKNIEKVALSLRCFCKRTMVGIKVGLQILRPLRSLRQEKISY